MPLQKEIWREGLTEEEEEKEAEQKLKEYLDTVLEVMIYER